jgi:hypothetical protein
VFTCDVGSMRTGTRFSDYEMIISAGLRQGSISYMRYGLERFQVRTHSVSRPVTDICSHNRACRSGRTQFITPSVFTSMFMKSYEGRSALEQTVAAPGLETRDYGRRDASRWPRGVLHPRGLVGFADERSLGYKGLYFATFFYLTVLVVLC